MQTASPDWVVEKLERQRLRLQNFFLTGENKYEVITKQLLLVFAIAAAYAYSYFLYHNTIWLGLSRHSNKIYFLYPVFVGLSMIFTFVRYFVKAESTLLLAIFYLFTLVALSIDITLNFHVLIFVTLVILFAFTVSFFYIIRDFSTKKQITFSLLYAILIFNLTNYLSTGWNDFILLKGLLFQRYIFVFFLAEGTDTGGY